MAPIGKTAASVNAPKAINTGIIIVVSVVGTVALVFILIKIWGLIKAAGDAAKKGLDGADIKPSNLSYTTSQYSAFANQLYDALDGLDLSHAKDLATVKGIFMKMNTYDDVRKLITAYGIRPVGNFSLFGWQFDSTDKDLGASLSWMFDRSEIEQINQILAAKNINYSF